MGQQIFKPVKNKYRILLVENDRAMLNVLILCLGRRGYGVICAEDAVQGLRLMQSQHPDLLLLDYWLPGGDGKMLMLRARSQQQIVALGQVADPDIQSLGHDGVGIDPGLEPIQAQEVTELVRHHRHQIHAARRGTRGICKPRACFQSELGVT